MLTNLRQSARVQEDWVDEYQLTAGPRVRFRHVQPDDEPLVAEAIRTASRETLLHRFFSPIRSVAPERLRQMLTIDRSKEVCLVGLVDPVGRPRIICGARYVRLDRPGTAEIALTVHDDFQRRGLGTFLLRLLCRLALREGIGVFEADVMTSNVAMLRLLRRLAPGYRQEHFDGDVYHLVMDLTGNCKLTTASGERGAINLGG